MPRVALITGASRGLGLALARALAEKGWALVIDARGAEALEYARAELAGKAQVVSIPGDVSNDWHLQALVEAAQELGGLDAVVNNASILGPSPQPRLAEYPLEGLEQVYRVNVLAPLRLIQLALPLLKPGGCILNITSDAAVEGYAGWGGYGSSKAALEQLSKVLAAEHPEFRVYWVDPGDINTRMHQEAFPGEDISDRPPPETSVPGLLKLIEGKLPSGRYKAREIGQKRQEIQGLRIALAVNDFERAAHFYRDGLGLAALEEWNRPEGRGLILDAGRATLELLDVSQVETVDRIEAGRRVSGPVRLAFEVEHLEAVAQALQEAGAEAIHPPVRTPWGDRNQRLRAPDGMQITLFRAKAKEPIS
ncbi:MULTISPECIES: SDR family NAD(P)-dependent oxidoreductase [unclassified Meiothermus]|uniref:SDR family NAD(P)-dependent oxidoreductase n=1 Tax=unclassified Meiothermus TaxID=370471 RepID=UPI000D7CF699|nr:MULTISPECIES: SDR family NAD(P)-dependent oxidoreductase [unclassified Meiothermus]PZA08115.1 short-chain dehydrogenase [Meiothermus sp. Pnk-1]RYM29964.1 SDR family NAD(P)-dependent oxidoreductase [Meiothermus sp. PNK-Is4]